MIIDVNFLYIVGGFISLGFALGHLAVDDKGYEQEVNFFTAIFTLLCIFCLSWAWVIGLIIAAKIKEE